MQSEWKHLITHNCSCGIRITAKVMGSRHSINIGRARPESEHDTDRFFWLPTDDTRDEVFDGLEIVVKRIREYEQELRTQQEAKRAEKEQQKVKADKPAPKEFKEQKPQMGLSQLGRRDAQAHGDLAVAEYDNRHRQLKKLGKKNK